VFIKTHTNTLITYEFKNDNFSISDLIKSYPIQTSTTIARITSDSNNFNYSRRQGVLDAMKTAILSNGDTVQFISEKLNQDITILVKGAHLSGQHHIVKKGTTLKSLVGDLTISQTADLNSLQLFRESVKKSQKMLLEDAANKLKRIALTTQSDIEDVAKVRSTESKLLVDFAEKSKSFEPSGQIVISSRKLWEKIVLLEGDIISIPENSNLISVSGEVLFPSTFTYTAGLTLKEYIKMAGGPTNLANKSNIIIKHLNGMIQVASMSDDLVSAINLNCSSIFSCNDTTLKPGDKIMILPEISDKNWAYASTVMKIIYQLAISASIVIGL
jgi:molybdopterin converting factor small subunit